MFVSTFFGNLCVNWHEFVFTAAKVALLNFIERNVSPFQFSSCQ